MPYDEYGNWYDDGEEGAGLLPSTSIGGGWTDDLPSGGSGNMNDPDFWGSWTDPLDSNPLPGWDGTSGLPPGLGNGNMDDWSPAGGGIWEWLKNNFKWDNAQPSHAAITSGNGARSAAEGRLAAGNFELSKAAIDLARNKFLSELPTTRARQSLLGDVMAAGQPEPVTHPRANVTHFRSIPDMISPGSQEMGRNLATSAQTQQRTNPNPLGPINTHDDPGFWESLDNTVSNVSGLWEYLKQFGIGG